ncbi:MAG: ABC transporter permease [Acetobacteraceae bacterium]|nr:ABC transporter permease [Acetobacteraceae bacterium]
MSVTTASFIDPAAAPLPPPSSFWSRFRRNPVAMTSLLILIAITLTAIFAPEIAPHNPMRSSLRAVLKSPNAMYWLGTDDLGRDVASRLIFASRLSLIASIQALSIALIIGLPLGLISGYAGGWTDIVITRINDAIMSFPALILAVVIVGLMGPSLTNAMTAIGIVYAPRIMRVVRGSTLSVREEVYIMAARATGCSDTRIIVHHVLPNIVGPLLVQSTVLLGHALLAEAGLSFLGLGAQPPQASWGAMLGQAFPYMAQSPVPTIAAGMIISVTVLCFNLLGDGLRDSVGRVRRAGE